MHVSRNIGISLHLIGSSKRSLTYIFLPLLLAKVCGGDPRRQLILASKNAVVRELWEETGIDVRGDLTRLTPTPLRFDFECNNELNNEHKKRLFYSLELTDDDFFGKVRPISMLMLKAFVIGLPSRHFIVSFSQHLLLGLLNSIMERMMKMIVPN